ncbi:MAG: hypothetical protein BWY82_00641 [Verrucomicrobia bacterium ADurb.Bin474]|nr:MAG: hypothetical protein BWY82_00641 [Verrucomicrobia bacterium ADurb.Bin474]
MRRSLLFLDLPQRPGYQLLHECQVLHLIVKTPGLATKVFLKVHHHTRIHPNTRDISIHGNARVEQSIRPGGGKNEKTLHFADQCHTLNRGQLLSCQKIAFALEHEKLHGATNHGQKVLKIPRLVDVLINRTLIHRLNRRIHIRICGGQDPDHIRIVGLGLFEQFHAHFARHALVRNQHRHFPTVPLQFCQTFIRAAGRYHLVFPVQCLNEILQGHGFVVHVENLIGAQLIHVAFRVIEGC